VKLAIDSYIESDKFEILDTLFTSIFIVECLMKVIAIGLIWEETTYLRDSWN
jgi:hypothetical protein